MQQYARVLVFFGAFLLFPLISGAAIVNKENNFLVISDIHLDQTSRHVMEINPSKQSNKNDLDEATFEKLIAEISKNIINGKVDQPEFIIILGDLVGHMRFFTKSAVASESSVFNVLKNNFPNTPLFYVFGNNDSLDVNYGPFKNGNQPNQTQSPYAIAKFAAGWSDGFLSTGTFCGDKINKFPCLITEDTTNGYYAAYVQPKLRLISLNSVLFSPNRRRVSEQDALNQLQWLGSQLKTAREHQESVLLAMHIPPGNNMYDHSNFWLPKEQMIFSKMLDNYQHTIIGLLAAHTHADELKIIKDSTGKNIAGLYLTAALSTSHGNEPSVKTIYFAKNKTQWFLSDYTAFHFSMKDSTLVFDKLYDYKNYYCDNKENGLVPCFDQVTVDKIKKYFSAGNPNYAGVMNSPGDMVMVTP